MSSAGSVENREELLSNFTSITGVAGERAQFYLEAAGWQLEAALSSFFEEGELDLDQEQQGEAPAAAAAGAGQQETRAPPPAAAAGAPPPAPATRTPGLVTMDSIRSTSTPQSDDQQAFYAGGSETSGQQVLGPRAGAGAGKQDLVKEMFKKAREHGAEEVGSSSSSGQQQRFQGTGYVLGEAGAPSEMVGQSVQSGAPRQRQVVLKLWSDGFTLDNGPLRGYHEQGSRQFLDAVREGEIPAELLQANPGTEIDLTMEDRHHEEYKPPKPERVAFQGEGRTLGSPLPAAAGAPAAGSGTAAAAETEAQALSALHLDESAPTTQLQLRFLDGTRMAVRVNHSHTIGDIYAFVNTARPSFSTLSYELTLFPNTVLEERGKSVGEAKLFNCALVQKMKK